MKPGGAASETQDTCALRLLVGSASGTAKRAAAAWLATGAALLAGCATLTETIPSERDAAGPDTTWQAHARELSRFRSWSMLGVLALRSGGDVSRVTMRWRQTRDAYHLRFMGPLGVGLFEIEGSPTGVEARYPNGRRSSADSPERLLEQEIGWTVPLRGLRYWLVGAPAPDSATAMMEIDDQGRLARLEQAGWTVVYERYRELDDLALPARVRFSSESVDATVVVRRWKSEPDPV